MRDTYALRTALVALSLSLLVLAFNVRLVEAQNPFGGEENPFLLWWFWVLIVLIVLSFRYGFRYYKEAEKLRRVVRELRSQLDAIPFKTRAKRSLKKDLLQRKEKIRKFEERYDMKIRIADSLDEMLKRIGADK